jgi:spermidine/putrescine-binding protein
MFKLIFKIISFISFLIIILIGLAVWKGGEPFRWTGEKAEIIGKIMKNVGDKIDHIKEGGKKAEKKLKQLKEGLESITVHEEEHLEDNDGSVNKHQKSE